jgi:hypothetical protein
LDKKPFQTLFAIKVHHGISSMQEGYKPDGKLLFRKNLAIERMIVEGCDILLDVNQVFVRQGTLIQVKTISTSKWWVKKLYLVV